MILFLDFDGTLFHTEAFKKKTGTEHISCVEKAEHCLDLLSRNSNSYVEKFLFADTVDFLKNHKHTRLILLTFGNKEYQKAKVMKSGILHFFKNQIFVENELKGDTVKRMFPDTRETMFFLDDDIVQLHSMKERCPHVNVVRMRRVEITSGSDIKQNDFSEVSNLKEFAQLLASF